MKRNIVKLVQRKGKFDSDAKVCKNCNKEFNEKENFNWSCRVHQSEWGGEMWWCCGKRGKEQPGCKFSKHETKDIEEDEFKDSQTQEQEKMRALRNMRCKCCKEIGHKTENCARDPNFLTNNDVEKDHDRIRKIKGYKKLHADTLVQTTHFIKKSVMVPCEGDDEGNLVEQSTNRKHPFMRGIMTFDDYNYNQFNEYVLIEEPKLVEKRRIIEDRKNLGRC